MEHLITKYIEFKKCYYCLLIDVLMWLLLIILYPVKALPQKPIHEITTLLGICTGLYVYLGFVKLSYINKSVFYRKYIVVAVGLSIVQYAISTIGVLTSNENIFTYNGIPFIIECIILYIAFKSVHNSEAAYFLSKLSRLYLWLTLPLFIASISLLLLQPFSLTTPHILNVVMIIFSLIFFYLIISILYWKIRLFRQLTISGLD
jgi:hypothetical protein